MIYRNGNKLRTILIVALCATIVKFLFTMYSIEKSTEKIPYTPVGKYSCFQGEMGDEMVILEIETTDDYIFYAYSTYDVVAAYDWNGIYQFSLAFSREHNGGMDIRCEDELLYVYDTDSNEFVFSGSELIRMNDSSTAEHSYGWFLEERDMPLVVQNRAVHDAEGHYIMPLPGKMDTGISLICIIGMICFMGLLIFCGVRVGRNQR